MIYAFRLIREQSIASLSFVEVTPRCPLLLCLIEDRSVLRRATAPLLHAVHRAAADADSPLLLVGVTAPRRRPGESCHRSLSSPIAAPPLGPTLLLARPHLRTIRCHSCSPDETPVSLEILSASLRAPIPLLVHRRIASSRPRYSPSDRLHRQRLSTLLAGPPPPCLTGLVRTHCRYMSLPVSRSSTTSFSSLSRQLYLSIFLSLSISSLIISLFYPFH
ncbi:hypothetical protein Syun_012967 [Stephania yunnanensis]|uniref:Uncharacterized protein n=1 Tax=Stephania yunnanensis TaxID=152371 RepID=A0AAP0K2R9_9MAGN